MKIQIEWRDRYPKLGLDNKYVGDQTMLCIDLPPKAFLQKGTKYRLLGKKKLSELQSPVRDNNGDIVTYELQPQSSLALKLCNAVDGSCSYPSIVELDESIECFQGECDYDILQLVSINHVLYEYMRPPCVNFVFFNSGKFVSKRLENGSLSNRGCFVSEGQNVFGHLIYSQQSCSVVAIVNPDGMISVIEESNAASYDSITYFHVNWIDEEYPTVDDNDCRNHLCETIGDRCRCRVSVEQSAKFSVQPSVADVISSLTVGAVPTDLVTYVSTISTAEGLKIHFKNSPNVYDQDTAFEVVDEFGRTLMLKNQVSVVRFVWSDDFISTSFGFRNPPVFYNPVPELR